MLGVLGVVILQYDKIKHIQITNEEHIFENKIMYVVCWCVFVRRYIYIYRLNVLGFLLVLLSVLFVYVRPP